MLTTLNAVRENIALVLSNDVVERKVGSRTAVYHRRLGGLCLLDEDALTLLRSFREGRDVPAHWFDGEAESREAELVQQLEAREDHDGEAAGHGRNRWNNGISARP